MEDSIGKERNTRLARSGKADWQGVERLAGGEHGVTELTMLDGNTLKILKSKSDKKQWRQTAASLMLNTVKVAPRHAPLALSKKQLEWLKDYVYLGNEDEECPFRVAVVDAGGSIKNLNGGDASDTHQLTYDTEQGFRADKWAKGQI